MIAARLPPLPDELVSRWPADSDVLASVRRLLRRWLRTRGATEEETYDITVACQEACANAVEHAYGPGAAVVRRRGQLIVTARIRLTVRDGGRWRAPRGTHRGRGLPLMRALMETVDVQHGDDGTVVVLERTLARRHRESARPARRGQRRATSRSRRSRARSTPPTSPTSATRLRGLLTNRSESLVVDLVATTYIDSAGINLLFELAAELRQRQQRLFLVVAERLPDRPHDRHHRPRQAPSRSTRRATRRCGGASAPAP